MRPVQCSAEPSATEGPQDNGGQRTFHDVARVQDVGPRDGSRHLKLSGVGSGDLRPQLHAVEDVRHLTGAEVHPHTW